MQDAPKLPQTGESTSLSAVFLSLSNAELLWRAKHLAPSLYLEHLPFLFWLVTDIRPKEVLTLGLSDGVAHFAVCQAIERQDGPTFCRGIRFEMQQDVDEKAKKNAAVNQYNETNYADFSVIENQDELSAHEGIETGSIDLLLLEQFPSHTLLALFEEHWLSKLGRHGVMLIPGTSDKPLDEEAQVWIDGLCEKYSNIHFLHGGGLIAIVIGDVPSDHLQHLIQLARTNSNRHHIQHFFERIAQLHALEMELGKSIAVATTAEQKALNNRNWAMRLQGEKDELTDAYDARHEAASQFQADLFDRSEETAKLRRKFEVSQNETAELRQQLEADRRNAEQFKADRFEEIAALTIALERQSNEITELYKKLEPRRNDAERQNVDHLEEMAALLESDGASSGD